MMTTFSGISFPVSLPAKFEAGIIESVSSLDDPPSFSLPMKRSVAIFGETPAFLRWAIELPCPFRSDTSRNVTATTFTDVRSLRVISVAEIERRIVDGVCLHPGVDTNDVASAKGFSVDEVLAAYACESGIQAACSNCQANISVSKEELANGTSRSKAGCFGWVPFSTREDSSNVSGSDGFMSLMEHYDSTADLMDDDLLSKFQTAFDVSEAESDMFAQTDPAWYGVWSQKSFRKNELRLLDRILKGVQSSSLPWLRLSRAVEECYRNDLVLHVDIIPPGHSDGATWVTDEQCSTCGSVSDSVPCTVCGSTLAPLQSRNSKVLGLRPYLNLVSIYGHDETERLIRKFRDGR